jgi:23S rRNA (guanosine2251-2'-O)-methyltransferase
VKLETLYGLHAVTEALAAGRRRVFEIHLEKGNTSARLQAVRAAAESMGIALREGDSRRLAALAGNAGHQGVAARVSGFEPEDFSRVLEAAGRPEAGPLLALDSIVDPHNLGAILRTALCSGVAAVILPRDRSAPPTPAVSRISAGALEHVRLAHVTNLARSLEQLKARGRWVVGLDRAADRSVFSADLSLPLVLVVGGEEKGIRPLVRRSCDLLAAIPQTGPLDSLNASAAGAVALYEIYRQRTAAAAPPSARPRDR